MRMVVRYLGPALAAQICHCVMCFNFVPIFMKRGPADGRSVAEVVHVLGVPYTLSGLLLSMQQCELLLIRLRQYTRCPFSRIVGETVCTWTSTRDNLTWPRQGLLLLLLLPSFTQLRVYKRRSHVRSLGCCGSTSARKELSQC